MRKPKSNRTSVGQNVLDFCNRLAGVDDSLIADGANTAVTRRALGSFAHEACASEGFGSVFSRSVCDAPHEQFGFWLRRLIFTTVKTTRNSRPGQAFWSRGLWVRFAHFASRSAAESD